jgi:hypothetical protein
VRNKWGVEVYNETFNYTSHKWIILPFYEFVVSNTADHLVRIDLSYNATYPNITIMCGREKPILLDPAVYRVIFTYYRLNVDAGEVVDFYQETGYYVAYTVNVTGPGGMLYSGIPLSDIQANIDQEGEETRLAVLGVESRMPTASSPKPFIEWDTLILFVIALCAILIIVIVIRAIRNDRKEEGQIENSQDGEIIYT